MELNKEAIEKQLKYELAPMEASCLWYCMIDFLVYHPLGAVLGRGNTQEEAKADFYRRAKDDGHIII